MQLGVCRFHHIKSLTKRKHIVGWGKELHLAGWSKPGYPGQLHWCQACHGGPLLLHEDP